MGYTNCPHAGNRSLIIMAIILFNKLAVRKNLYFVLFQKQTELSDRPNN